MAAIATVSVASAFGYALGWTAYGFNVSGSEREAQNRKHLAPTLGITLTMAALAIATEYASGHWLRPFSWPAFRAQMLTAVFAGFCLCLTIAVIRLVLARARQRARVRNSTGLERD